jgi:hypothetical protein
MVSHPHMVVTHPPKLNDLRPSMGVGLFVSERPKEAIRWFHSA